MTDWETRYLSGDTPWEKGEAHPALLSRLCGQTLCGRWLAPGCGSGHDVRILSAHGAQVTGLDLAPSAIVAAERWPRAGDETYLQGDFFHLPENGTPRFDGLFEHTCFCAIDPADRLAYAAAAATVLRPGGLFWAIFYLDPDHEDGPPFGCSRDELDALFGTDFRLMDEQSDLPTYAGREGREVFRVWQRRE